MRFKLGLYAIPFGFGPVSKAIAIAKALSAQVDVEWHMAGSGISLEYMQRENLATALTEMPPETVCEKSVKSFCEGLQGAVVLMDNVWANYSAPHTPTFFADSLGFMWHSQDFANFPGMNQVKKYYVQDMFGAFEHLKNVGISNAVSVPPVIDIKPFESPIASNRMVIHLGGLINPFNPQTTRVYLEGMRSIIDKLGATSSLVLMSQAAKDAFPELLMGLDARSLPHGEAVAAINGSSFTYSSPGLTTMLEMARSEVATAPLPPQNYSQALNVRNMVSHFGDELAPVWHFLDRHYQEIVPGMPEELGVQKITRLNLNKLRDPSFQAEFADLARQASEQKTLLPGGLVHHQNGAEVIARDIRDYYDASPEPMREATLPIEQQTKIRPAPR